MPIGNPVTLTSNVASKAISVTATASQTLFNVTGGYRINELGVFKNGLRLQDGVDYTARDGLTVTLLSAASGGDKLQFVVFDTFRVAEAIRPAVDEQTIRGNLNVVGILSATNLEGPLSFNLTSGIQTFHDVRVGGALTVARSLTYEDTTNTNTTGIATFSGGMNISGVGATVTTLNVTGVSTFAGPISVGDTISLGDHDKIRFGAGNDLEIYHDGSNSYIKETAGTGNLRIEANDLRLKNGDGTEDYIKCNQNAAVELFHNDVKKFETTGAGVTVTGVTTSRGFVLAEDDGIHFRTTAADDLDAILRENSSNTLLINSRNDAILNIDSNNDSTDAHFAIGHGAATGSSTELFRVQENGNVGIGSAIPGYMLDIASTNASMRINSTSTSTLVITSGSAQSARIEFGDLANNDTGYIYYDNSDDSMQFATNGSNERLRITSAGKVGINSEGTTAYLTIRDSEDGGDGNNGSGVLRFSRRNGSATKDAILYAIHDGSDGVRALKLDVGNSERFRVSAAGVNVTGITTASQLFEGTNRVATAGKAVAMALVFG